MDSTSGTAAVSVCASNPIRAAVHRVVRPRASADLRLIVLDLEPSYQWWTDEDPFDLATSETIYAKTGTSSEPARTPAPLSVARTVYEEAGRLSGETLIDNRPFWHDDPLAVGGPSANHKRWVRQKIIEGGF